MSASIWGFVVPDTTVVKPYPAYELVPQETGGRYVEIRELSGDLWIVQNAQFNASSLTWLQQPPYCDFTQSASASVYRATGAVQFFNVPGTGSATAIVNWGTPYWSLDPTGSSSALGATRAALVQNVPADGSVATPVNFITPFTNACQGVTLGIDNAFQTNQWQLSAQYDTPSVNGFNLNVSGGPAGSQVSVFYVAVGN